MAKGVAVSPHLARQRCPRTLSLRPHPNRHKILYFAQYSQCRLAFTRKIAGISRRYTIELTMAHSQDVAYLPSMR